ncbi:WD repeat-containing protein 43 [Forsythia ovata]|uniref:WD repeat-containing protein 43 n=1 Tax=Forsythia ovata TaxID=205694 RepID=A0ABD1PV49_9LAMI
METAGAKFLASKILQYHPNSILALVFHYIIPARFLHFRSTPGILQQNELLKIVRPYRKLSPDYSISSSGKIHKSGLNDFVTVDDGEEDNGKVTPIIYEDNDEGDDKGSIDSMEIESNQDGEKPQVFSDISDDEISD